MKNNIENLEKTSFDPDAPGVANGNFFGLPCGEQEADTVIVQVPWDATVSYGKGTADGPQAMLDASLQVDLFDERFPDAFRMKVWTLPEERGLRELNCRARGAAEQVISALEQGQPQESLTGLCGEVNACSAELNAYVEGVSEKYLSAGKSVVLTGGEHSVPLGLIKALARRYPGMGILHIDAHSDTRNAYEGFKYSHASIMYNAAAEAEGLGNVQCGCRGGRAGAHYSGGGQGLLLLGTFHDDRVGTFCAVYGFQYQGQAFQRRGVEGHLSGHCLLFASERICEF